MSTWTPESIRALGVKTDLPTLGKIFGVSRARAYPIAPTPGNGSRLASASSRSAASTSSPSSRSWKSSATVMPSPVPEPATAATAKLQSAGNAADDAITGPSGPAAASNLR